MANSRRECLAIAALALLPWLAGASRADLRPLTGPALNDRACSAARAPEPQPATLPGCTKAWCAGRTADALCLCERPAHDGQAPGHVYLQADAPARSWPAEVSPMLGPEAFAVSHADLDGDGIPDRIVEQRAAVSNGMAVAYARLCVWPSSAKDGRPVCREVEDWGFLTRLVHEPGRQACSLVDGGWRPGLERGRGDGTYAVARVWRLSGRSWQAAPGRPWMARRLLRSFEDERGAAQDQADPPLWYQNPGARSLRCPDRLCDAPGR